MARDGRMIVVSRNGKTTVVTGWRAWLIGSIAACLAVLMVFLALGAVLTLTAALLIAIPSLIGIVLIASAIRPRPR